MPRPLSGYNHAMLKSKIAAALEVEPESISPVVPIDVRSGRLEIFDFTTANTDLTRLDINDVAGFTEYLFTRIAASEVPVGIGRYDEDRVLYRHSPLFDGTVERRSIHLGIDLFVVEGTAVHAPLPSVVHSLAENTGLGNYGPTVILGHRVGDFDFFSLYGHLSRATLESLETGQELESGQALGTVGGAHENGGWPPHLHFQLICEPPGNGGDYPGVAAPSERERSLELCPNPNLILGIPGL